MSYSGGSIGPQTQSILKGPKLFVGGAHHSQLAATIRGFTTRAHLYPPALTSVLRQVRLSDEETDLVVFSETDWNYLHADEFIRLVTRKSKKFVNPLVLIECLRRKPDMIHTLGSCGTLWYDESEGTLYYLLFASINKARQTLTEADEWTSSSGGRLTRWLWTPFTST